MTVSKVATSPMKEELNEHLSFTFEMNFSTFLENTQRLSAAGYNEGHRFGWDGLGGQAVRLLWARGPSVAARMG